MMWICDKPNLLELPTSIDNELGNYLFFYINSHGFGADRTTGQKHPIQRNHDKHVVE